MVHAHDILSHLKTTPGSKVKESHREEETCGLRAASVNFACFTLEDYSTIALAPQPNLHGCRVPSKQQRQHQHQHLQQWGQDAMKTPPTQEIMEIVCRF